MSGNAEHDNILLFNPNYNQNANNMGGDLEAEATILGSVFHTPSLIPLVHNVFVENPFSDPRHIWIWNRLKGSLSDPNIYGLLGKLVENKAVLHDVFGDGGNELVKYALGLVELGAALDITGKGNKFEDISLLVHKISDLYSMKKLKNTLSKALISLENAALNDYSDHDDGEDVDLHDTFQNQLMGLYQEIQNIKEKSSGRNSDHKSGEAVVRDELVDLYANAINVNNGYSNSFIATADAFFGISALDEMLGGIYKGGLYTVAGATGLGKTAFAVSVADTVLKDNLEAQKDAGVYYWTGEMPCKQIMSRFVSRDDSGLPIVRRGNVPDGIVAPLIHGKTPAFEKTKAKLLAVSEYYKNLNITDAGRVSIEKLTDDIRWCNAKHKDGLSLVVIDYLQLMKADNKPKNANNRVAEITLITQSLKALSIELDIPILMLAQLNRSASSRAQEDRRPRLSDLKESSSIEQDSDVVLFLYREEEDGANQFDMDTEYGYGKAIQIIVEKHRHGLTGVCEAHFYPSKNIFV